jgi:hypothetical protein
MSRFGVISAEDKTLPGLVGVADHVERILPVLRLTPKRELCRALSTGRPCEEPFSEHAPFSGL